MKSRQSKCDNLEELTRDSQPELQDKVVVVTGAAGGIGRSIANAFARVGASVLLADIRLAECRREAENLQREGRRVAAAHVDVSHPDSTKALFATAMEKWGAVDVLVNNAGIDAPRGLVWELPDRHWRTIIDTNLSGCFWMSKTVIPHMISRQSGRIIMISSESAYRPSPLISAAYNAAKAGLVGLTIGLAKQLEPHGVLVNAIAPGPTGTGNRPSPQEEIEQASAFPLGVGGPAPVARACLYLAGNGGAWTSGAVLNVSGGRVFG